MDDLRSNLDRRRTLGGVILSLSAAAALGVFTPAAKGAATHLGPLRAAGLTYLIAGIVALSALALRHVAGLRSPRSRLVSRHAWRLAGMTLFGGILGPALFFEGVFRVPAHHVAVLQHVEFVLTLIAATLILRERPGWRGTVGIALVGMGVVLFSITPGTWEGPIRSSWAGMALIVAACAAWAVDNTLAREASEIDPLMVVGIKGMGAGLVLLTVTGGSSWALPARTWVPVLLAGGIGVGASLVMELLALRRIGAALNAGLFATGPAFAFVWSLLALGENAGPAGWAALVLCAMGAVSLAVDRHVHHHTHDLIRHTHRHHHLDGHHAHHPDSAVDPAVEHVHEHEHERLQHSHPHVHDEHHRHSH